MRNLIELLWKEWKTVEDQIKGLSGELERISAADPGCTRIRQIPGSGLSLPRPSLPPSVTVLPSERTRLCCVARCRATTVFDWRQGEGCSASANAGTSTCARSSSTEHGLQCCGSSGIGRRSEPGSMHSMPELRKMLSWSRWRTSLRGSHGLCCRAERTTGQTGILLPHEIVRKRRLRLGSADALPLYRTTTTTD